ncbi:hypothetical protein ACWGAN_24450 [Streptomyces sp. NPDC054945]
MTSGSRRGHHVRGDLREQRRGAQLVVVDDRSACGAGLLPDLAGPSAAPIPARTPAGVRDDADHAGDVRIQS